MSNAPQPIELPIEGMTCDHCEVSVRKALEKHGARQVQVNFRTGKARFLAPTQVPLATFSAAVAAAGYRTLPPIREESSRGQEDHAERGDADYDLAIIGSGSAAFSAAIEASKKGHRVVMVEQGTVGGTCVNVGCVPSKALLRAAQLYDAAGQNPFAGILLRRNGIDLAALVAQKDELVGALRQEKYLDLMADYGWAFRHGEARFEDEQTISVDGQPLRASAYLIATGASPTAPPISGLAEAGYLTSTTALELEQLPKSLVVIGANAIGLELGQLFAHLGTKVTLVEVLDRIAPFEEPEISALLRERLEIDGLTVLTGAKVTKVEAGAKGKRLQVTVGKKDRLIEADDVLVATGRRPNTAALNLDAAGIAIDKRGGVRIDANLRTTNPKVFAAGDVTDSPQFVYVAAYQGRIAAQNALELIGQPQDLSALPRITFTNPQIASVGLTEAQALEHGHAVKIGLLPLKVLARAQVDRDLNGLYKIIIDAETDRILGLHILAPEAGDSIYAGTLAVKFKLTRQDLLETFAPYLTYSEGVRLAAQSVEGDPAKMSCCA